MNQLKIESVRLNLNHILFNLIFKTANAREYSLILDFAFIAMYSRFVKDVDIEAL